MLRGFGLFGSNELRADLAEQGLEAERLALLGSKRPVFGVDCAA